MRESIHGHIQLIANQVIVPTEVFKFTVIDTFTGNYSDMLINVSGAVFNNMCRTEAFSYLLGQRASTIFNCEQTSETLLQRPILETRLPYSFAPDQTEQATSRYSCSHRSRCFSTQRPSGDTLVGGKSSAVVHGLSPRTRPSPPPGSHKCEASPARRSRPTPPLWSCA
mmetsp:Transcript_110008/g.215648  ORF Transcript_110008/g.215648 Transcript_110008/m.215648 type:complete len:168 (-) Transcript_110008:867-1370(-)